MGFVNHLQLILLSFCAASNVHAWKADVRLPEGDTNSPAVNVVRIFNESNFNGHYKDINLSTGCVDIRDEWEGRSKSIKTFHKCIVIYRGFGCTKPGDSLVLNNSKVDVQTDIGLNFVFEGRSIELCPEEQQECKVSPSNIIVPTILGTLLGGAVVGIFWAITNYCLKKRMAKWKVKIELSNNAGHDIYPLDIVTHDYEKIWYEISKARLEIDLESPIGYGCFSNIYKGRVRRVNKSESSVEWDQVAVKILKPYTSTEFIRNVLKEIKTLIYVRDNHRIVQLIGCCTENLRNGELYVLTSFCENGSLGKFLRSLSDSFTNLIIQNERVIPNLQAETNTGARDAIEQLSFENVNTIHLIQWAIQIAEGLEYLAFKKVVHGGIATRNMLLDTDFSIKISDFGSSNVLYEYSEYVLKEKVPLPWRWLALESLSTFTFSIESDIWGYGVTLWEIFSLGCTPFPERMWNEDFFNDVSNGMRLSKPKYATTELYNCMLFCWREKPSDRINAKVLRANLTKILTDCGLLAKEDGNWL